MEEKKLKSGKLTDKLYGNNNKTFPCKHRWGGICKKSDSKWYNNRVTGDYTWMCEECDKFEN